MLRISRLTAVAAALVMTAFTFAPIGSSSVASSTLPPAQVFSSLVSADVIYAAAVLRTVLHSLS